MLAQVVLWNLCAVLPKPLPFLPSTIFKAISTIFVTGFPRITFYLIFQDRQEPTETQSKHQLKQRPPSTNFTHDKGSVQHESGARDNNK